MEEWGIETYMPCFLQKLTRATLALVIASSALTAVAAEQPGSLRPATRSAAAKPVSVKLARKTTGTYYIPGEIAGYGELDFLVDTGSSYVVINEVILTQLRARKLAKYSRDLDGIMANGSSMPISLYRLSALKLGENCWVHDVEAAVFPGATRTILGMNVLSQLAPIIFSIEPPALSLNRCQQLVPEGSLVKAGLPAAVTIP